MFGVDDKLIVRLNTSEYSQFYMPPGNYRFFIEADAGNPHELKITLKRGDKVCLKGYPNPYNYVKNFIPFVANLTENVLLEVTSCPSEMEISKLRRIAVKYKQD